MADRYTYWRSLNVHFTLGTHVGIIIDGNRLPIGIAMMKVGSTQELKTFFV